jgi:hypothetical protein
MRHAIKSLSGYSPASARVVDGKLVLSLPHALTPVVWQMDLTQASASALEVHDKNGTGASLTLKTPRGETTEIAVFETRALAVSALMSVSKALENARGKIRSNGDVSTVEDTKSGRGLWVAIGLVIILFFVLANIWGAPPQSAGVQSTATAADAQPGTEVGVPVKAEDIIGR